MIASSFTSRVTGAAVAVLAGASVVSIPGLPAVAQVGMPVAMAGHSVAGWHREVTDTPPPGRQWTGFAYDAALGEFVLFGGDDFRDIFGDTWTRKHGLWTWLQLTPAKPPRGRGYASMAYDSSSHRILMFGGYNNTPSAFFPTITARWDGDAWHRAS